MKPKYLYIDDEEMDALVSFIHGFTDLGQIGIEILPLEKYKTFEEVKTYLARTEFDGLIIDLRLDGNGPNRVDFTATTLAQDFRTAAASGEFRAIPIILCSTNSKMRATYDNDMASHDLFDFKFEKTAPDYIKFSRKFLSLAEDYIWLNQSNKSITDILKRDDLENIDVRIYERFEDRVPLAQEYARFVINEFFHHPGVLIKERVVAARLGIDIEKSPDGWAKIKSEFLKEAKYSGLFSIGWERWWADKVVSQFKKLSDKRLSTLNAEERIAILTKQTGIEGLVAAKPLPYCYSSEFWTICEGLKMPLEPLEGFKIYESSDLKPWQESKYISFQASEVERIGRDRGLRPHPSEKERIDRIKLSLEG